MSMKRISRWGIGPIFAAASIIYAVVTMIISRHFGQLFKIESAQGPTLIVVGVALILLGIPFFVVAILTVSKAYKADKLVTGSVFRCCRHPLYASWVVFIAPGIVLLSNNWISLSTPVFMYVILRLLVRKEEEYLEERFGADYLKYKSSVPCILPYGSLLGRQ